ncbi:histidine phosphatase family protein [Nocardioides marmoribigeumensis]
MVETGCHTGTVDGRRLVIMRHAAAAPHASNDADRPLTSRGRSTAAEAGEFLRSIGVVPDHVLVSPARRCTETWAHLRAALDPPDGLVEVVDDRIYAASADSVLEVLRSVPETAHTVLLIGHNPSVAYVASVLADADGPMEVLQQLLNGMLPGALAVYETSAAWAGLDMLGAKPTHFHDGSAS